jgi:hypothetical protein
LFRTAKYRPDYPSRSFTSKEAARQWVALFAHWYNHRDRQSGIKFVTPHQGHNRDAVEICHHRAVVYKQTSQSNPRWRSRSTRCLRQPEAAQINRLPPETQAKLAALPRPT